MLLMVFSYLLPIEIKDFSLSQLKQMQEKIQSGISKMILDSDLIIKAAIIEQAIAAKEGK